MHYYMIYLTFFDIFFLLSKANRKMGFASPIGRPLERVDESGSTQMRKRFVKKKLIVKIFLGNYGT